MELNSCRDQGDTGVADASAKETPSATWINVSREELVLEFPHELRGGPGEHAPLPVIAIHLM